MNRSVLKRLERARHDAIVILGIGGYVPVRDFVKVFDEIDAVLFAKIIYATDRMVSELPVGEWCEPTNIPLMIDKYNFAERRHFGQVVAIFQKYFEDRSTKY